MLIVKSNMKHNKTELLPSWNRRATANRTHEVPSLKRTQQGTNIDEAEHNMTICDDRKN